MLIPDFSKASVMIVGDLMLDRYWVGPTSRISPEAPVPVVKINTIEERPGGAANVALNVCALGTATRLAGLTGADEAGESLQRLLQEQGIDCRFQPIVGYDTITKLRVLSRNQQLIRLDFEKSFAPADKSQLVADFQQHLEQTSVVVLSDYAKGCLQQPQSLIKAARRLNKPVIVDPKGTEFEKYRGATLLTPNMSEFQAVVGECHSDTEIVRKGQELIQRLQLEALLVTRSEHGMTLIQKDTEEFHLPAKAREVFDVTGAGDTVVATMAASLAAGMSLKESCILANAAAGVVVAKLGTSTVSIQELQEAVRKDSHVATGVMSEQQLKVAMDSARSRGEKMVMTNGCFDILHAGHVSYLENAGKLGERLIVAVNSDESVRKLKGDGRPVNGLQQRMAVLAGLASVDWVVDFSEDTPERLISNLLPDILVKGGDYKPEDIAGGKQVIANGGDVRVLNFEDGVSTTNIINRIKDDR